MIKFKSLNQSKEFRKILKKKSFNTKYFKIYFDKNSFNLKKKFKQIFTYKFCNEKKYWKCCSKK